MLREARALLKTKLDGEGWASWTKYAQAESHRMGHPCNSGFKLMPHSNPWVPFVRPKGAHVATAVRQAC